MPIKRLNPQVGSVYINASPQRHPSLLPWVQALLVRWFVYFLAECWAQLHGLTDTKAFQRQRLRETNEQFARKLSFGIPRLSSRFNWKAASKQGPAEQARSHSGLANVWSCAVKQDDKRHYDSSLYLRAGKFTPPWSSDHVPSVLLLPRAAARTSANASGGCVSLPAADTDPPAHLERVLLSSAWCRWCPSVSRYHGRADQRNPWITILYRVSAAKVRSCQLSCLPTDSPAWAGCEASSAPGNFQPFPSPSAMQPAPLPAAGREHLPGAPAEAPLRDMVSIPAGRSGAGGEGNCFQQQILMGTHKPRCCQAPWSLLDPLLCSCKTY
ncbi:uncharacterized protein LOC134525730 [Chroicocephalus ridibundus]|uniref:uncharacterized protein LOC134525730 n=1 Tax=Chroicocephalus ridibundus TaxID=1192867 RepID=UPI002FDC8127